MGAAPYAVIPVPHPVLESVQTTFQFDGLSALWVLVAAILVFFTHAGVGVLEAGLVRTKNAGNVLVKNATGVDLARLGSRGGSEGAAELPKELG